MAVAALLAAPTLASAQAPLITPQLNLPVEVPMINFDHGSTVQVDGNGVLSITNASATDVIRAVIGNGNQSPTIDDFILIVLDEQPKNADGSCPSINGIQYFDLRGNGKCQQDYTMPGGTLSVSWGRLTMRLNINTTPTFDDQGTSLPGVPLDASGRDACGVLGGGDNFCVKGEVFRCVDGTNYPNSCSVTTNPFLSSPENGIVLRGRIRTKQDLGIQSSASFMHALNTIYGATDFFEYVFEATGGTLAPYYHSPEAVDPIKLFDVNVAGLRDLAPTTALSLPGGSLAPADFTTPFIEPMVGFAATTGYGAKFVTCTSQVSGSVTDYFTLTGIPGAAVKISDLVGNVDTNDANGSYPDLAALPPPAPQNLCAGLHTVTVLPPAGYTVSGADTQTINFLSGASVISGINFKLIKSPVDTSAFMTFSQAAWGTKPKGDNAGMLLKNYFPFLYPTGELVVGIPDTIGRFSITETGSEAVRDFLPQEGIARPLSASYVDPGSLFKLKHKGKYGHSRRIGSLAGETLALELNVRASALFVTKHGLGSLYLASGPLKGWTVDQVLAAGNTALGGGGLPPILTPATLKNYDTLEDTIERINRNYQAGTKNSGFLVAVPLP